MILGQTPELWFVRKDAGLPVFPPHDDASGDCVLHRLFAAAPKARGDFPPGFEGGIAHRLDTLTSGFVVVAQTPAALTALRAEWSTLRKFYRFRSAAPATFTELTVTAPIAHHPRRADRVVVGGGDRAHRGRWREAWTHLRRLGDGWWEAEIRTGALHQVRAHAAFAGVPLDGDRLYGGADTGDPPTLVHVGVVGARWSFWLPTAPGPPGRPGSAG
jgi:23S rRNA-/tRNA-specific pseudouridylate synthase